VNPKQKPPTAKELAECNKASVPQPAIPQDLPPPILTPAPKGGILKFFKGFKKHFIYKLHLPNEEDYGNFPDIICRMFHLLYFFSEKFSLLLQSSHLLLSQCTPESRSGMLLKKRRPSFLNGLTNCATSSKSRIRSSKLQSCYDNDNRVSNRSLATIVLPI